MIEKKITNVVPICTHLEHGKIINDDVKSVLLQSKSVVKYLYETRQNPKLIPFSSHMKKQLDVYALNPELDKIYKFAHKYKNKRDSILRKIITVTVFEKNLLQIINSYLYGFVYK